MQQEISVVIPAFNEEASVGPVIEELRATLADHALEAEILVVDDGSGDGTALAAARAGARVIQHRSNRGYGAALKSGIAAARNELIAILDADGTYPARFLPEMLEKLQRADMVVGARIGKNVHIPWIRRPAKWALNRIANYLSGEKIPDLNSGLRVFRRALAMQYFPVLPDQFSWTTTLTLSMHCDNYAVRYHPIDYRQRTGKSKIVPRDASNFAVLILRTAILFKPLRAFTPVVVVCFGYGLVKMVIDLAVVGDRNISASALLMFMSALIILLIGMLGDAVATRLGRLSPNAVLGVSGREATDFQPPAEADEEVAAGSGE